LRSSQPKTTTRVLGERFHALFPIVDDLAQVFEVRGGEPIALHEMSQHRGQGTAKTRSKNDSL
jgi:hypothetical protein